MTRGETVQIRWARGAVLTHVACRQMIPILASLCCPMAFTLRKPLLLVAFVVSVYSAIPHKEFRFIYPILPLCMIYAGHGLWFIQQKGRARLFKLLV